MFILIVINNSALKLHNINKNTYGYNFDSSLATRVSRSIIFPWICSKLLMRCYKLSIFLGNWIVRALWRSFCFLLIDFTNSESSFCFLWSSFCFPWIERVFWCSWIDCTNSERLLRFRVRSLSFVIINFKDSSEA